MKDLLKTNRVKVMLCCLLCILASAGIKQRAAAQDEAVSITFEETGNEITIVAAFDLAGYRVISTGLLMAPNSGTLTMDTVGRERITFTALDSGNRNTVDIPNTEGMKNTAFRAFAVVRGADGAETVLYSVQFTPKDYLDGTAEIISGNVRFRRIEGGLEVAGVVSAASNVVVPETVNGMTVIKVGDQAFENDRVLVSIDLPDTVEVVGKRAFAGCTALKTMN